MKGILLKASAALLSVTSLALRTQSLVQVDVVPKMI